MKTLTILWLILVGGAAAQVPVKEFSCPPGSEEVVRGSIISCVQMEAVEEDMDVKEEQAPRISSRYDKFKGSTFVKMIDGPLEKSNYQFLLRDPELLLGFSCPGKAIACQPRLVEVMFTAGTSDWQLNNSVRGILLIDGKSVNLGRGLWDGQVLDADDLTEYITFNVPPQLLMRLAHARRAELQLGVFEFVLPQETLTGIKELARQLTIRLSQN